jgi:hypothetical protein
MTAKVVNLQVGAGIQRDDTQFASNTYVDGKWVRFQYGRPRKIGGYNGAFLNASGISRGMIMSSDNGLNYVISGYTAGIERWTTDNDDGVGFGPTPITSSYTTSANTLWQFDIGYDALGNGKNNLIAHPGQNLNDISSTVNTTPLYGEFTGTTLVPVGVFTASGTTTNASKLVTFATTNIAIGAGVSVSGTGIPSSTVVDSALLQQYGSIGVVQIAQVGSGYTNGTFTSVAIVGSSGLGSGGLATVVVATGSVSSVTVTTIGTNYLFNDAFTLPSLAAGSGFSGFITALAVIQSDLYTATLSNAATASGTVTLTFDNNVSVSGGIVMLYPYLFAYGNNGLIKNCAAGDFNNWTSSDSNENNVSSTKVIKGLPLRGGTTSPAGLFWTLDSVVRVTYAPTTVGNQTLYWRYDLITQQSSIMSSQCVIEYDGIFYWAGTDRFLMYNGVVQEVENKQNFNYFFDNLNYAQRQKIWVSKVPRWGEIWWFFPSGDSTECNDAIIYNVREKTWYDAGEALGARRSAGVFSEVFRRPIWGGNEQNTAGKYTLWQHENGTNQIYTNIVNAIESYVETNVIGSNMGLVGTPGQPSNNVWTRIERIEPDFIQSGTMQVIITGKSYADDVDDPSDPYSFDPTTLKIDMKEQRREMRLRFISNTQNGDFFLGRVVLSIDTGDVRGTGNP